jgi:hypothetical protein
MIVWVWRQLSVFDNYWSGKGLVWRADKVGGTATGLVWREK